MSVLKESRKTYIEAGQKLRDLKAKVELKNQQINRLNNRIGKAYENSWWGDILIRPLMVELKARYPEMIWDDERLIPMGMRNAVSVFGKFAGQTICAITFTPVDLTNGIMHYDTGEIKTGYQIGSIGNMNGFNRVTEPLTSIDILFNHVDRQVNKNELKHLR